MPFVTSYRVDFSSEGAMEQSKELTFHISVEFNDRRDTHYCKKVQKSPRVMHEMGPLISSVLFRKQKFLLARHACTLTLHRRARRLLDSTNAHHPKLHLKQADKSRGKCVWVRAPPTKVSWEGHELQSLRNESFWLVR